MPLLTVPGVDLPSGETIPTLGQGTWHLGQGRHPRAEEIRALREGVDLGMTLIDTAEMYGDGRAEELVGEAIASRRDDKPEPARRIPRDKVYPHMKIASENAQPIPQIGARGNCARTFTRGTPRTFPF